MSIKLPKEIRPREKARRESISKLSNVELLALFLKFGTKNKDVLDLSKEMLERFGSLNNIIEADISMLEKINGIGPVKSLEFKAIQELIRRIKIENKKIILTKEDAALFAHNIIGDSRNEKFLLVLLNRKKEVIYHETIYIGTIDEVAIEPNQIIAIALRKGAHSFYCFHNHPSGIVKPSLADKIITSRIKNMSSVFSIKFLDHIIINSSGDFLSFGV